MIAVLSYSIALFNSFRPSHCDSHTRECDEHTHPVLPPLELGVPPGDIFHPTPLHVTAIAEPLAAHLYSGLPEPLGRDDMMPQLGSSSSSSRRRPPRSRPPVPQTEPMNLICCVCLEMFTFKPATMTRLSCSHPYCNDCLRTYIIGKAKELRYPIVCPVCPTGGEDTHITQDVIEELGISAEDLERLSEAQLLAHAVLINCPSCKESMHVDRKEYIAEPIVTCPLPDCQHRWCKGCQKSVKSNGATHRCKDKKIDRIMRKNGWKYCPGCRTPVEKMSGCNHMECEAPGCSVHFCYNCGGMIIDTKSGGNITNAVARHHRLCRLVQARSAVSRYCWVQ